MLLGAGDGELAFLGLDDVVLGKSALVQLVGEAVVAAADVELAAGDVIGDAFALDEAVAGDGDLVIGERSAVVDLLVVRGGHNDLARGNCELAVNGFCEAVVYGDVGLAAHDAVGLDDVCAAACVELAALDDCGKHIAVNKDAGGESVAAVDECGAVIHLLAAVCGDSDLGEDRLDGEFAFLGLDDVVCGKSAFVQFIGEAVVAAALVKLAAGHGVGRTLALSEAVSGDGNGGVG